MPPYDSPELAPVIDAIRQAGRLSRLIRDGLVEAIKKDDRSPVTVADFAVQCVIARFLQRHTPDVPLVGEETSAFLRTPEGAGVLTTVTDWVRRQVPDATPERILEWIDRGTAEPTGRFWTLDPIDGTKGFLRGNHYAIALALIEQGQVTACVVGCPTLDVRDPSAVVREGTLAVAAKGRGAWWTTLESAGAWQPLRVADTADLSEAVVLQSLEAGHSDQSGLGAAMARLGIRRPSIRMDSLGKYVVLAAGAGHVFCRVPTPDRPNYKEKIWDQAAGAILIAEAGGRVSDVDGKPLDFSKGRTLADNRGVLATNGRLHEPFLKALAARPA
jgi:3'(2'), 5'-bisphosphate nucleotidase